MPISPSANGGSHGGLPAPNIKPLVEDGRGLNSGEPPIAPLLERRTMSGNGYSKRFAGVAQLVEHQLPKLRVVGSSPIARFIEKPR